MGLDRVRRGLQRLAGRAYQSLRVLLYRAISVNRVIGGPLRNQPIYCEGVGNVSVDPGVWIGWRKSPGFFSTYAYLEARNTNASVHIGARTAINNNFRAIAEFSTIEIGSDCRIGPNVEILDSDFHGLSQDLRGVSRAEWCRPVVVGNNVFIGGNVVILKGTRIGDGSVIANGSVVTRDVPANVVAGGNPARVIRALTGDAGDGRS